MLAPVDLLLPDEPVDGEIVGRTLGDLEVARLRSSTNQTVHRTPGLIRSHSCGVYRVVLSLSRTAIGFEQGENACRLVYNELVVYDVDRPYHVHHAGTGDMDFVVVSIPRDRLPVPEGAVAAVTATALAGGVSALAGSMLRHTARDA
ncbi:MAG: hypothetical protein HOQ24_04730, partial [Mycobacteriaceae bacterium]|nr:hypothetical protein [Mycobacteriaceae bacterium]